MEVERLQDEFIKTMGEGGEISCYFAPGRVNLIGEHTDYNGGHVFPCALTIGTWAAVRPRKDRNLRLFSMNFPDQPPRMISLDALCYQKEDDWCNYPKGVVWAFKEAGYTLPRGLDILYHGNLPNSAGLSSSACIEVLTGKILLDQFGWKMDGVTLAKLTQKAENEFNGVNCGIMDQFAIAMGKKDHAIFLDTADLSYTYVPLSLQGMRLVIACSNKKRGLADSKYNERRSECEAALAQIQKVKPIQSLGDLTTEEFEALAENIADPVQRRRARHAVTENQRTIQAVSALQQGDLEQFGQLMNASHRSLRDDYEVTGKELDTLVETAWKQPGVLGSRMTGAGFGGCTISLVREECVDDFMRAVGTAYLKQIGYAADFYSVSIGDGPHRL
ncbi:MAG TPA: galactokinase [Candidatus Faecimorpha stercoravium]|nr:galactokinase [Candidatus Faecimorpha stercoravium]